MCVRVLAVICFLGGYGVRTTYAPDGTSVSEVFFGLGSSISCGEAEGVTASVATLGMWTGQVAGLGYHQVRFFVTVR